MFRNHFYSCHCCKNAKYSCKSIIAPRILNHTEHFRNDTTDVSHTVPRHKTQRKHNAQHCKSSTVCAKPQYFIPFNLPVILLCTAIQGNANPYYQRKTNRHWHLIKCSLDTSTCRSHKQS